MKQTKVLRYETPRRETLKQRLGKFLLFVGGISAIVFVAVVTTQLSSDTLAMIVGILLAGAPSLGIVGLVLYWALNQRRLTAPPPQTMTIPPVVMQLPQSYSSPPSRSPSLPDYGLSNYGPSNYGLPWPGLRQPARQWEIIGEE